MIYDIVIFIRKYIVIIYNSFYLRYSIDIASKIIKVWLRIYLDGHRFSVVLDYLLIKGSTFMATSIDNVDLIFSFSRTRPSLLSLLMMWIRLSFCAGRWSSLTALLKGKALLGSVRFLHCDLRLVTWSMVVWNECWNFTNNGMQIVHKKTASVMCLTTVKNEDKLEFSKILEAIKIGKNGILWSDWYHVVMIPLKMTRIVLQANHLDCLFTHYNAG